MLAFSPRQAEWRLRCQDQLEHGEFESMVESDPPFGPSTARRLKIIAEDARLSNRAHAHVLPPSWRTLYELKEQAIVLRRIVEYAVRRGQRFIVTPAARGSHRGRAWA